MSAVTSARFQTRDFAKDQSLDSLLKEGAACVALTGLAPSLHLVPRAAPWALLCRPFGAQQDWSPEGPVLNVKLFFVSGLHVFP